MKMSVQDQLAPYLNRFVILLQEHAIAKLEFSCLQEKSMSIYLMT